eukprot:s119_g17.t1
MSVQPTPRSVAASGSADAANVVELTGRVFEDFKRTAKYLAQLSEDYTFDPDDAFIRIDLNSDHRIDRTEFEQEINEIRGLLGTRKLAAALAQVQPRLQTDKFNSLLLMLSLSKLSKSCPWEREHKPWKRWWTTFPL